MALDYVIVATKNNFLSVPNSNATYTHEYIRSQWNDVLTLVDLYGVEPAHTKQATIKVCRTPNKKYGMNSGEGLLRECNKILSTYMRSLKFNMTGYVITAIPISNIPSQERFESIDQFAYDIVMPAANIHAFMFATVSFDGITTPYMMAGTSERNEPKPMSNYEWAELQVGDIIEYSYAYAYSNMDDSWSHRDPVIKHLLVTKVTAGSFSYRHVFDFDKKTFSYSGISEHDLVSKKKIMHNRKCWDFFYHTYHFEDYVNIVEIIRL